MSYDYSVIEEITNDHNYMEDLMAYEPERADDSCNIETLTEEDTTRGEDSMTSSFDQYDSCIENYYDEDNDLDD